MSGNFKNVPKSCSYRYQHDVAFRLLKSEAYSDCDIIIGPGSTIMLSELNNGAEVNGCLGNIGLFVELYEARWVEVNGIK